MDQQELWDKILAAWNDNKIACHIHFARLYTERYPKDYFGWISLADVLSGIASYGEALIALRTARKLCPKNRLDDVYHQIGHHYRSKGDHRRAEIWYRKAVDFEEKGRNLVFLGACLAKQGKYQEAKHYHQRAINNDSEVADEGYYNLGMILRAEGDNGAALECFEKAIELDPEYKIAKDARDDITALLELKKNI